jgi:AcrR family transcriptional regulator
MEEFPLNVKNETSSGDTRQNILSSALSLIKEYGFQKVTINQICKEAGITKSTFFYYFPSKNDLLEDFTTQVGHIAEKEFPKILSQDTYLKQFWEMFNIYFIRDIEVGQEIVKQIFVSHLTTNAQTDFPHSAYLYQMAVNLIKKSKDNNEISNPASPEALTDAIYMTTRGVIVTWGIENGSFDLIEANRKAINTLLAPNKGFEL